MRRCRAAGVATALAAAIVIAASGASGAPQAGTVYLGEELPGTASGLGAPPGSTLDVLAPGVIDDAEPEVVYAGPGSWTVRFLMRAVNGTVHRSSRVGNTAEIPVQGSRVTIYYVPMKGGAIMDVYLDAVDPANRIGAINQSKAYRRRAWALHIAGIDAAPHTLILRQRTRGRVNLDAVVFHDDAAAMPADPLAGWNECRDGAWDIWEAPAEEYVTYRGLWSTWESRTSVSWRRRDTATFAFTGNAFILYMWMNRRDRSLGRLRVLIDGAPAFRHRVINQRRGRRGWHLFYWKYLGNGDPAGHTVTVRHARGKRVNVQGFNAFDLPLGHTCP